MEVAEWVNALEKALEPFAAGTAGRDDWIRAGKLLASRVPPDSKHDDLFRRTAAAVVILATATDSSEATAAAAWLADACADNNIPGAGDELRRHLRQLAEVGVIRRELDSWERS
jgi:hypothetical protein